MRPRNDDPALEACNPALHRGLTHHTLPTHRSRTGRRERATRMTMTKQTRRPTQRCREREISSLLEDAEGKAADDRAAIVAKTTQCTGTKPVEIEQGAVGDKRQQQLPPKKPGHAADRASQRIIAMRRFRSAGERPRRKISSAMARNARPTSVCR